jgi:hypothetical protein
VSTPIKLDPDAVAALFRRDNSSSRAINDLYTLVVPELADPRLLRIEGYPTCSPDTWTAICHLAMATDGRRNAELPFDKQFLCGGAWMNCGFSTNDRLGLALWEVLPVPADKLIWRDADATLLPAETSVAG